MGKKTQLTEINIKINQKIDNTAYKLIKIQFKSKAMQRCLQAYKA
jgi:hypothetical protein